jgi:type VI secretion system secreted protein Hcp
MFLKLAGVTGESSDSSHIGEIEVLSWSWGLQGPLTLVGSSKGRTRMNELTVVKRVDQSTVTLMTMLANNANIATGVLTVRKAGGVALPYFKIEMADVRVATLSTDAHGAELVERLQLGFKKVTVTYSPQQSGTGAKGGGDVVFTRSAPED